MKQTVIFDLCLLEEHVSEYKLAYTILLNSNFEKNQLILGFLQNRFLIVKSAHVRYLSL